MPAEPSSSSTRKQQMLTPQPVVGEVAPEVSGPTAGDPLASDDVSLFTCLAAYSDALDALPLDLTRSFSDLRELDAVLGPHITSLIARLSGLNDIVRDVDGCYASQGITPGQRLLMLKECAEEARGYRMGGEDKIRVALNTCETIISHTEYIDAILDTLTSHPELKHILDSQHRRHVAGELSDGTPITVASANAATLAAGGSGIFANPSSDGSGRFGVGGGIGGVGLTTFNGMEVDAGATGGSAAGTSKRKKATAGEREAVSGKSGPSSTTNALKVSATASGSTKKRKSANATGDDDLNTPSKKVNTSTTSRKKVSAAAAYAAMDSSAPSSNQVGRAGSRGGVTATHEDDQPSRSTASRSHPLSALASGTNASRSSRAGSEAQRRDEANFDEDGSSSRAGSVVAAPSGTRSRPARAGASRGGAATGVNGSSLRKGHAAHDGDDGLSGYSGYDEAGAEEEMNGGNVVSHPTSSSTRRGKQQTLERTASSSSLAAAAAAGSHASLHHSVPDDDRFSPVHGSAAADGIPTGTAGPGSAGGEDADERRYCFCNNVSYGDMIGCDDDACEREWFHLGCVGLTKPPSGTWYCDDCLERRAAVKSTNKSKSKSSTHTTQGLSSSSSSHTNPNSNINSNTNTGTTNSSSGTGTGSKSRQARNSTMADLSSSSSSAASASALSLSTANHSASASGSGVGMGVGGGVGSYSESNSNGNGRGKHSSAGSTSGGGGSGGGGKSLRR